MAKLAKKKLSQKGTKKQIKAEIIVKLTDALKEYKTPKSEKKLTKKIKKAGKSITPVVLKSKKDSATISEKKTA
jgi:hypothetical protein